MEVWALRSTIRQAVNESIDKQTINGRFARLGTALVRARTNTDNTVSLAFEDMFKLDPWRQPTEETGVLESCALVWPNRVGRRTVRSFGNGSTLCEIATVMRNQQYALGFLQLGQLRGWWEVVYDENVTCAHQHKGECMPFCTLALDKFNTPPRRKKRVKERKPFVSKFRLPDFMPQPGVSIA